jgi:CHAT domain-containing protein
MRTSVFLLLFVSAFVSSGQTREVDGFLNAWSSGDVAGAAAYWPASTTPAFDRYVRRALTNTCVTVHASSIEAVRPIDAERAEAVVTLRATLRNAMPGAPERYEVLRVLLPLKKIDGHWRIDGWRDMEEQFVDELLALPTAGVRSAWLDARAGEWSPRLTRVLSARVTTLLNRDQVELAAELLAYCMRVAEDLGDEGAKAYAFSAAATSVVWRSGADVERSVALSEEGIRHAELSGDPNALAMALMRRGRAVPMQYSEAKFYERALSLTDYVDDLAVIATSATHLSRHHESYGEVRLALQNASLAARLAQVAGNESAELGAELNFASLYMGLGDPELAALHYDRVAVLARRNGFEGLYASHVDSIVAMRLASGQPPESLIGTVNEALTIPAVWATPDVPASLLLARARLHLAMGNIADAEADVAEALAAGEADDRRPYLALAEIRLQRKQYDAARIAMDLAPRIWSVQGWANYAAALRGMGQIDEAMTVARCAIDYTEFQYDRGSGGERARQSYLASRYSIEQLLVDLLVQRGRIREALVIAEGAKARLLRDVAGRTREPQDPQSADAAAQRKLTTNVEALNRAMLAERDEAKVTELRTKLAHARLELDDFLTRAAARERGSELYENPSSDLQWPHRNTAALQYMVGEHSTNIFVVRADANGELLLDVEVVPVERAEVEKLTAELRGRIAARDLRYGQPARRLYDLLIAPVEKRIAASKSLCVIPDGVLWKVPFQALLARDQKPLIDRIAVFYAPSIRMLQTVHGRGRREGKPRLLALGNPSVGSGTAARFRANERATLLGDLVEAEDEVRRIARLYGAARSEVYVRDDAREAMFKQQASRFDVLHVASHGLVDNTSPRFSALVLASAPDDGEDGLLEAHEVADLVLDADLVVLSACETATGKVGGGEGILGLSWAFLAAGAETLVGSQWKAPSAATEALMVAFHERLLAGDSVAEALRFAQKKVRRDPRFEAPLDWAPFVVVGDGL